jgi:hypothetical protein
MEGKTIAILGAGALAFMLVNDKVAHTTERLIIGDIEMLNYNIHLLQTDIFMQMPVKNASVDNLSFDGFKGYFVLKNNAIAEVNILDTVVLTAGQKVNIPIKISVYSTTLLGEFAHLWDALKTMLQTGKFNEEAFLNGTVYTGAFTFDIHQRIF